jgi:hypothetical protein
MSRIFPALVANRILNVELEDGIGEQFDPVIFDISGKSLLKGHNEQLNTISLDLSVFPPGMFIHQIRSLYFSFSDKFILKRAFAWLLACSVSRKPLPDVVASIFYPLYNLTSFLNNLEFT